MFIMSKALRLYKAQIQNLLKDIALKEEARHLHTQIKNLKVVFISSDNKALGAYKTNKAGVSIIAINKTLMNKPFEHTISVVEHEVAHYIAHVTWPSHQESHGKEYKAACKMIGADPRARAKLEDTWSESYTEDLSKVNKIIDKVKKLLSLSSSLNKNESEVAAQKANELLAKHNLTSMEEGIDDKEFYQHELVSLKRRDNKYNIIGNILETFGVFVIWNKSRDRSREGHSSKRRVYTYILEICGERENVEVAKEVYEFLDRELERLAKDEGLKGNARKSFFMGVSAGYMTKIRDQRLKLEEGACKSLVAYNKEIERLAMENFYSDSSIRTRTAKSSRDPESYAKGFQKGESMNINTNNKKSTGASEKLLLA